MVLFLLSSLSSRIEQVFGIEVVPARATYELTAATVAEASGVICAVAVAAVVVVVTGVIAVVVWWLALDVVVGD
jgi:hypothetical protein